VGKKERGDNKGGPETAGGGKATKIEGWRKRVSIETQTEKKILRS